MTKRPPEPFMDKEVATKNRSFFPTGTQKIWPQDPSRPVPYKRGRGYTRRPDVVIVKDTTKPPAQDMIKQVVEMKLFVEFARRLHAAHGYAGYSLVLSALRNTEYQAFEAFVTSKLRGFDAGDAVAGAANAHRGTKTVGWLAAINHDYLKKIGDQSTSRSELPMDWFWLHDYGAGVVIQAGPRPEPAPAKAPLPALLVLPNMLLQSIRTKEVGLHYASANSESRLIG